MYSESRRDAILSRHTSVRSPTSPAEDAAEPAPHHAVERRAVEDLRPARAWPAQARDLPPARPEARRARRPGAGEGRRHPPARGRRGVCSVRPRRRGGATQEAGWRRWRRRMTTRDGRGDGGFRSARPSGRRTVSRAVSRCLARSPLPHAPPRLLAGARRAPRDGLSAAVRSRLGACGRAAVASAAPRVGSAARLHCRRRSEAPPWRRLRRRESVRPR